ncbi:MAG TPA: enoyl-CoA hydratase-related protein [Egibacteraceae bacterium]|nr:enoyl-CoA hydratase-related protein [Egibacteraceae bacterium]
MLERERDGKVLRLTFADPERRNALGYAEVGELLSALRDAEADAGVRAVLLTGQGSAFSAGGNLKEFQAELKASAHDLWDSGAVWADLFHALPRLRLPVVAAVNGPAMAGACGLVAACDLAIASQDASLGLTEVKIGLFPIIVLPAVRRAVGERVAREMALTGRILDAGEALRAGLVNRVVAPEALQTEALGAARDLADLAPAAMALGKRLLADTADLGYDEAVRHARAMRAAFFHTDDVAEGVAAFLEKRRPQW